MLIVCYHTDTVPMGMGCKMRSGEWEKLREQDNKEEYDRKMHKKCRNICTYQIKAVPLYRLLEDCSLCP